MLNFRINYAVFSIPPSSPFPSGDTIERPMLRLKLVNAQQRLSCYAMVDSGADYCAFPLSFARIIGLDTLKLPSSTTMGVGGNSTTFYANVQFDVGPLVLSAYCGFTSGLDQVGFGLLGQQGFFDKFTITFDRANHLFDLAMP